MGKFVDAITEAGLAKIFWLMIAVVCFFLGAMLNGFLPGLVGRLGYAALGIFVYININVFIKYYSKLRGVIGWSPDISDEEKKAKFNRYN